MVDFCMDVRTVVMTIVSVTIGIILVGSLLIPMAQEVIDDLNTAGQDSWASLVSVVVVVTLISLVVVALYAWTSKN